MTAPVNRGRNRGTCWGSKKPLHPIVGADIPNELALRVVSANAAIGSCRPPAGARLSPRSRSRAPGRPVVRSTCRAACPSALKCSIWAAFADEHCPHLPRRRSNSRRAPSSMPATACRQRRRTFTCESPDGVQTVLWIGRSTARSSSANCSGASPLPPDRALLAIVQLALRLPLSAANRPHQRRPAKLGRRAGPADLDADHLGQVAQGPSCRRKMAHRPPHTSCPPENFARGPARGTRFVLASSSRSIPVLPSSAKNNPSTMDVAAQSQTRPGPALVPKLCSRRGPRTREQPALLPAGRRTCDSRTAPAYVCRSSTRRPVQSKIGSAVKLPVRCCARGA